MEITVLGFVSAFLLVMFINPLSAEAPKSTDDAPLMISIRSIFSAGINSHCMAPVVELMTGSPSSKTKTLDPAP